MYNWRVSRAERKKNLMNIERHIIETIERKLFMWYGNLKRIEDRRIPKVVVEWEPDGGRRKTKPVVLMYNMTKYDQLSEDNQDS